MKRFPWTEQGAVIVGILMLLCAFFHQIIFQGRTFKTTTGNPQALISGPYGQQNNKPSFYSTHTPENSMNEEPTLAFIRDSLRRGILPLWNPHVGCGYPLIGLIQAGMFFPLNYLYYLLPDMYGWDALLLGRMFVAGFFMYGLMRFWGYAIIPSLTAMILFMLGRPMVTVHAWMANVDILLPLLFLCLEKMLREPAWRNCGLAAGAIGLTVLAGHPEHLVLVHALGIPFFIFRWLTTRPRQPFFSAAGRLTAAYALGLSLSAMVLFPFIYNMLTEFWTSHPADMGARQNAAFTEWFRVSFLFPNFFLKYPEDMQFNFWAWWGSTGVLTAGLAILGLWESINKKLKWFFFGAAAVFMAKTFVSAPWVNWIGYLPLLNLIRFDNHIAHALLFLLSVLGGMGMQTVQSGQKTWRKFAVLTLLCLSFLAAMLWHYRAHAAIANARETSAVSAGILLVFLVLLFLVDRGLIKHRWGMVGLLAMVGVELMTYVPRYNVNRFNSFPDTPYINFIKKATPRSRAYGVYWTLYPNTAAGFQIDDLGINHGLLSKRFVGFVNNFLVPGHFKKDFHSISFYVLPVTFLPTLRPYLDLLNVRYTVAPRVLPRNENFDLPFPKNAIPVYSQEANIYAHSSALDRAFIVHRAVFEPDPSQVAERMTRLKNELRFIAVLQKKPDKDLLDQLAQVPLMDNSRVKIKRYLPDEVVLEALMEHPGLLVLGDTYHPEWRATVDGTPAEIYCTDYMVRSVFLPAGKHTVRFFFLPLSYRLGLALSGLALITTVSLLIRGRTIKRNHYCPN